MSVGAATLVIAFVVAVVLTPLFRQLGWRLQLVDVPNERSSHVRSTPRTGGLAIMLGILASALVLLRNDRDVQVVLGGAVALGILALVDDVKSLPNALRLVCQLAVAIAVTWFASVGLHQIELPYVGAIHMDVLATAIAVFWLVGLLNAYNFMDGINGIASMEAIVCGATYALLAARHHDAVGTGLALAVVGGAAGFLPWNMTGTIFMGDVGSTGLGLLLGYLALRLGSVMPFVAVVLPLLPFLFDTSVTIVRRMRGGERFFSTAHRTHFYQLFVVAGHSHAKITLLWAVLAACGGAVALTYEGMSDDARAASLLALLAVHVVVARSAIAVRDRAKAAASR